MVVLTSQARIGPVLVPWSGRFRTGGRIAQSVERWSNKPLVMGSSPIVTTELLTGIHSCIHSPQALTATRKRAPKIAPPAGRGPLETPPPSFFFQDSGPDSGPEIKPLHHPLPIQPSSVFPDNSASSCLLVRNCFAPPHSARLTQSVE